MVIVMDSFPVGVAVATAEGDLLYTNGHFLEMLGQAPVSFSLLHSVKGFPLAPVP